MSSTVIFLCHYLLSFLPTFTYLLLSPSGWIHSFPIHSFLTSDPYFFPPINTRLDMSSSHICSSVFPDTPVWHPSFYLIHSFSQPYFNLLFHHSHLYRWCQIHLFNFRLSHFQLSTSNWIQRPYNRVVCDYLCIRTHVLSYIHIRHNFDRL